MQIGSSVTHAGKDSCLTAFDLKHTAKTDLEEPFYNEVGEKQNVIGTLTAVSMLFGSHGKRTETYL